MVLKMRYGRVGWAVALGNRFVGFVGFEIDAGARGTSTKLFGRPTTSKFIMVIFARSSATAMQSGGTRFRSSAVSAL
jgi:hypothetical protein